MPRIGLAIKILKPETKREKHVLLTLIGKDQKRVLQAFVSRKVQVQKIITVYQRKRYLLFNLDDLLKILTHNNKNPLNHL